MHPAAAKAMPCKKHPSIALHPLALEDFHATGDVFAVGGGQVFEVLERLLEQFALVAALLEQHELVVGGLVRLAVGQVFREAIKHHQVPIAAKRRTFQIGSRVGPVRAQIHKDRHRLHERVAVHFLEPQVMVGHVTPQRLQFLVRQRIQLVPQPQALG